MPDVDEEEENAEWREEESFLEQRAIRLFLDKDHVLGAANNESMGSDEDLEDDVAIGEGDDIKEKPLKLN